MTLYDLTSFFSSDSSVILAPNLTIKDYLLNDNSYIISCDVLTKFLAQSYFTEHSVLTYVSNEFCNVPTMNNYEYEQARVRLNLPTTLWEVRGSSPKSIRPA